VSEKRPVVMEGVWKEFRRGRRTDSLRDLLAGIPRKLLRRGDEGAPKFWALQDVSLEVRAGGVLGIIGANGAGKSTVLKLLSRVMGPTRGRVSVEGRVGALVELAAGFHPDLSGRENVFLQGAILGMSRRDIAQRFDEIVAFAEVEAFLDTPVKRYSSGMHARLGFAVAAHLSPDVLLVDEVLAVGDHRFQRRAFARLKEVVQGGAAVVVVSHHLERVVELADDALLLVNGAVAMRGRPEACVEAYIAGASGAAPSGEGSPFHIESLNVGEKGTLPPGGRLSLTMVARSTGDTDPAEGVLGVRVWALPEERVVFSTNATAHGVALPSRGVFTLSVELHMNVGPGLYRVQGVVWRRAGGDDWQRAGSVIVRVQEDPRSFGPNFLDPQMRLIE